MISVADETLTISVKSVEVEVMASIFLDTNLNALAPLCLIYTRHDFTI